MKYYRIKVPNTGYCSFYSFSLGLIMKLKYDNFKIPSDFESQMVAYLKTPKVQKEIVMEIRTPFLPTPNFISNNFDMDCDDFISNVQILHKIETLSCINELISYADTIEKLYAVMYAIGVALVHLANFKKFTVSDLRSTAYQCGINLTLFSLYVNEKYNPKYQYNIDRAMNINISYSYKEGHFEYLSPISNEQHMLHNEKVIVDVLDLSNRKFYEGSYYNYVTKVNSLLSKNKNSIFYYGSGFAITFGIASVAYSIVTAESYDDLISKNFP